MEAPGDGLLRRISVHVLLQDYVSVRVCNLHNPHYTGHIENYKEHTLAFFLSHLVHVQFSGSQTQAGWWCVYFKAQILKLSPHNRPFATNGHMVQNPPYWRASS